METKEQIIPIKEEPKVETNPTVKLNIKKPETKIINQLPSWSLEPPLEINRSKTK
jgi:hypothetical protein